LEKEELDRNDCTGNIDVHDARDASLKYTIVQKRWTKLYSAESSLRLQDAGKKHVY
jgi:hypothetical protein